MALVVRRYALVGPSNLDLSRFPGHGAVQSVVYPAAAIDIQIDNTDPDSLTTLDAFMKNRGWVFSPSQPPQVGFLAAANVWTKQQQSAPVALVHGANVAIDAQASNVYTLGLIGATAQLDNPSNLNPGQTFMIVVTQDAVGGRALTFDTKYSFGLAGTPDFTTSGANKVDLISCEVATVNKILCVVSRGF